MSHRPHEVIRKLERCLHCGKRIFRIVVGKYALATWLHYGYALRECDGLTARYAEPKGVASDER